MSTDHSTAPGQPGKRAKPAKPSPDYPLYAHATGYWAKKIRGHVHYFGRWDDPEAALKKYLAERDDLTAGRKQRENTGGADIKELVNRFLNFKQTRVASGHLAQRTWNDCKAACDEIVAAFGKQRALDDLKADDFAALWDRLSKRCGTVRLGNVIQYVRSIFKYASKRTSSSTPSSLVRGLLARRKRCYACTGRNRARSCSPPLRFAR